MDGNNKVTPLIFGTTLKIGNSGKIRTGKIDRIENQTRFTNHI